MKLENYRPSDIETVVEVKKMVQHQIGTVELCNWTDQIEEAITRTEDLLNNLHLLKKMRFEKLIDDKANAFVEVLKAQGITAQAFKFTHKKTD